jgi:hypothetical protein
MHDERVRAVQDDVVTLARIKCHQCFATIKPLRISRENISKLEDRVVGNGIEVTVAVERIDRVAHPYFYKVALLYGPLSEHLKKIR